MTEVPDDVRGVLSPNEQVQMHIRQKFYGPKVNVDSVVITDQRIILRHPHALRLKKDYTDYNYVDISNVVLHKGVLRSTIRCILRFGGEALALDDLPNTDAEKAYGLIRENLARYQTPYASGGAGVPPMRQQAGTGPTPAQVGFCKNCGTALASGQRFCGNCGSPV